MKPLKVPLRVFRKQIQLPSTLNWREIRTRECFIQGQTNRWEEFAEKYITVNVETLRTSSNISPAKLWNKMYQETMKDTVNDLINDFRI